MTDSRERIARLEAELRVESQRRQQAEATLEETYAALLRHQEIGGTGDYRFNGRTQESSGSQQSHKLWGFPPEPKIIPFRSLLAQVIEEDRERIGDEITESVRQGGPLRLEFRVNAFGRERVLSSVAEMHVDAAGDPIYLGVLTDVTEQRASEAALAQLSSELERASRLATLGEIAGSIIHEINQPLAAIMNSAEACTRWLGISPPEPEEARLAAAEIVREAERAAKVVQGLKTLVRGSRMQSSPLQINEVVREVLALSRPELERLRVGVRLSLCPELPVTTGDRVQLQQVVFNLVRNGLDAMHAVDDHPRTLTVSSRKFDANQLLVEVQDAGEAIDAEDLKKLFDVFFTTKPDGLGFGLSISRKIITAHRGRIWAEPNRDHGLKVSFLLPAAAAQPTRWRVCPSFAASRVALRRTRLFSARHARCSGLYILNEPNSLPPDPGTPSAASFLAKLLRPFARVEGGEVVTAVIMTVTVFLLLTAYYVLKTAREPLVLLEGGAEVKAYAAAGQSVLLVPVLALYSAIARRVGRMKLLASVYLFFVFDLVLFAVAVRASWRIGIPFYLWVGVFNVMTIAQFWSFATDIYTPEQGKRLFAILGIGSSVGAVAGARIAHALVDSGTSVLMLTSTLLLCVCVALLWVVNKREGAPALHDHPAHEEPLQADHVWRRLAGDRYLVLIAALTLVLNWVNNNGEYLIDRTLLETAQAHAAEAHVTTAVFIGRFKSEYFSYYNVGGVLLQLFAVSRIMRVIGVRGALNVLPTLSVIGYAAVAMVPGLRVVEIAKVVENSLDYSLQNTARQTLFLVTDRVGKYIGKTVIDTLMMRLGDVLAALTVGLGAYLSLGTRAFALLNVVLVAAWAVTLVLLGREYARRSKVFLENAPVIT